MNHGRFVFGLDLAKIGRYAKGEQRQEPAFDFRLCKTVADVREHCRWAKEALFVATDTETSFGCITVVSFTYNRGGALITFCVPFFDPWKASGAYWSQDDFAAVLILLEDFMDAEVPKAMQNGMYDCAYFIEAGIPPRNYILDTKDMMHAIWIEAPKALHEIASYFLDNYRYWKDDAKGVQEDDWGKTTDAIEKYWRYNGLDTYYTWLCARELLSRVVKLTWAVRNYNNNISLAAGPCLAASLRGMLVDKKRHGYIMAKKREEASKALEHVKRFTNTADFNPRSPQDTGWFLYDVLGAKQTRLQKGKKPKYGKKSADEKVLKLIREQRNFLADEFIDRHLAAKKPAGVLSNFGDLSRLCRNGRFLSWLGPSATKTFRFNSTKSQFWTGRNAQNVQGPLREMFVADPDYVLVEIDYSASDDRFIAYECEDAAKIETVEGTRDSHCLHCSIFFSLDYDTVERGWKRDESWVVDEPKGVRQITKKITHGRNYREEATTMYNLMGRDAVVATAVALGHPKAEGWTDKELIGICAQLIDKYDHPTKGLYKRIRPWQNEICELLEKNKGLMTNAFGLTRKFFGSVEDHKIQRELAAQYGQSNTAGNCNRALRTIYYSGIDDGATVLFLNQVHDSLIFAVHRHYIYRIGDIVSIMERPVTIHGRPMRVPASPKVGLTWSKKMLSWTPAVTYADVVAYEEKVFGEKYSQANAVTISGLDSGTLSLLDAMEFGEGAEEIDEDGEQLDVVTEELEDA
jgi:hypothetical protein